MVFAKIFHQYLDPTEYGARRRPFLSLVIQDLCSKPLKVVPRMLMLYHAKVAKLWMDNPSSDWGP